MPIHSASCDQAKPQQCEFSLDRLVLDTLRLLSLLLTFLFLALSLYYLVTPGAGHEQILLSAICSSIVFGVIWRVTRLSLVSTRMVYPLLVWCTLVVLMNLFLQQSYVDSAVSNSLIPLVIVGAGGLFLSRKWLLAMLAVSGGLLFWVHSDLSPAQLWETEGFTLLCAAGLSFFVNLLRLRAYHELTRIHGNETQQKVELEHALKDLRAREEMFQMLGQSLSVGVFKADQSGKCVFSNSRWKSIAQISFDELTQVQWYAAIHELDQPRAIESWNKAVSSEERFSSTFRLKDKNGLVRWGKIGINPVCSDGGMVYFGTVEDITEARLAENELKTYAENLRVAKEVEERNAERLVQLVEELEEARNKAEVSTRSKSEFLANMSHEIRTPMTAILGYTDLLLEQYPGDTEIAESLSIVQKNGEFLLQIINDILDISKIEAGKLQIEQVRCQPKELIEEVYSLMEVRAKSQNVPLIVEYRGAIPEMISTDPVRVRQILFNLISNAIKFTKDGFVKLRVSFLTDENKMQFEVIDSGIGMSAEQLALLFQPFSQADQSTTRKYGGTGLGLTISKRLAVMLEGDINVQSEPGQGSTFTATIGTGSLEKIRMVTVDRRSPDSKPVSQKEVQAGSPARRNEDYVLRILLAEDGIDNQRLISLLLKKAGMEVTVVENGKLALDLALDQLESQQPFDAILMDMQMPVMDGYSATRALRDHGYRLPIIALTAHAMSGDRDKCIAAGCNDYATKPINRQKLIEVILDSVQKQDAQKQNKDNAGFSPDRQQEQTTPVG